MVVPSGEVTGASGEARLRTDVCLVLSFYLNFVILFYFVTPNSMQYIQEIKYNILLLCTYDPVIVTYIYCIYLYI